MNKNTLEKREIRNLGILISSTIYIMTRCSRGTRKNKDGECVKKNMGFQSLKKLIADKPATAKKIRKSRKCKYGVRELSGKCPTKPKKMATYHQPVGPIYDNPEFNAQLRPKSILTNSLRRTLGSPKETWEN